MSEMNRCDTKGRMNIHYIESQNVFNDKIISIFRCGHAVAKFSEFAAKFKENIENPVILILLYFL